MKDGVPFQPNCDEQKKRVFEAFVERYPNIKCIARHVRFAHSGGKYLSAYLWKDGEICESRRLTDFPHSGKDGRGRCICSSTH